MENIFSKKKQTNRTDSLELISNLFQRKFIELSVGNEIVNHEVFAEIFLINNRIHVVLSIETDIFVKLKFYILIN